MADEKVKEVENALEEAVEGLTSGWRARTYRQLDAVMI